MEAEQKRPVGRPKKNSEPSEFPGLTLSECCIDCSPDRCVITNRARCGHPRKGGLAGDELHDSAVVDLYRRARKSLQHYLVDTAKD